MKGNRDQAKRRSRQISRKYFWDFYDPEEYVCPDCGRGVSEIEGGFQIHHKDGNPYDWHWENLIALCRLCHMLREDKKPNLASIRRLRDELGERVPVPDPEEVDSE